MTGSALTADLETADLDCLLDDLAFDLVDDGFDPKWQVMLAHVRSPDEFYVHLITQQSGQTLDKIMKTLNTLFDKANRRRLTKLSRTFESAVGKMCCAQFSQDDKFYR